MRILRLGYVTQKSIRPATLGVFNEWNIFERKQKFVYIHVTIMAHLNIWNVVFDLILVLSFVMTTSSWKFVSVTLLQEKNPYHQHSFHFPDLDLTFQSSSQYSKAQFHVHSATIWPQKLPWHKPHTYCGQSECLCRNISWVWRAGVCVFQ